MESSTRMLVFFVAVALLSCQVAADYGSSGPSCYGTGERCAGALGYDRVDYKPCCRKRDYCSSGKNGQWGSFCAPREKYHFSYSPRGKKCYPTNERCAGLVSYAIIAHMPCCSESDSCVASKGHTYSTCRPFIRPEEYDEKNDSYEESNEYEQPDMYKKPSWDDYRPEQYHGRDRYDHHSSYYGGNTQHRHPGYHGRRPWDDYWKGGRPNYPSPRPKCAQEGASCSPYGGYSHDRIGKSCCSQLVCKPGYGYQYKCMKNVAPSPYY